MAIFACLCAFQLWGGGIGTAGAPSPEAKDRGAPLASSVTNRNGAKLLEEPASRLAGAATNIEALDNNHRLVAGDRLSFRILEDEEDSKTILVFDSGEIEAPYVGRFSAEGKTCRELATALKAALEKEYYYQATVIIAVDLMAKTRGRVYLVGAVRTAGAQEIPSDEVFTLSKAILRAGGFTDFADKQNVRVTRKGPATGAPDQTFVVNVKNVLERGKTYMDLPLAPGDFIYIPERALRF